jgi:hypothetical protein
MNSADDVWLPLLLVALAGLLLVLRVRFPNASRKSENAVLVASMILFFVICGFFLSPRKSPTRTVEEFVHTQANR